MSTTDSSMTVRELIAELEKIENKELKVIYDDGAIALNINYVKVQRWQHSNVDFTLVELS